MRSTKGPGLFLFYSSRPSFQTGQSATFAMRAQTLPSLTHYRIYATHNCATTRSRRTWRVSEDENVMEVVIKKSYEEMSQVAAQMVAELLNTKPNAVLGMATGSTPLGLYQELVRLYDQGQIDFSRVITFNLDEYVGLPFNHPQSYSYFM